MIESLVTRLEGGQIYSKTLRKIFSVYHHIEIGMYSYGGCFNRKNIGANTKVGRYCSIAEGVCVLNGNHPLEHKSMHPFFYNPMLGLVTEDKINRSHIEIGNDVWIGRNVLILPRVKSIGDGAVIGAGSVVTRDVPAFAVIAGNPATVIRYRFAPDTIAEIRNSRWWEQDLDQIRSHLDEFFHPL